MAERSANHLHGRDPTSGIPMKLPSQFFQADVKALLSKIQIECKDCLSERLSNAHYSFERERAFLNNYTIIREREREDKERTIELKRRFRRRLEDNAKREAEQQQLALAQAINDSQTSNGGVGADKERQGAELTSALGAGAVVRVEPVEPSANRVGELTTQPTAEAAAETRPMAPQRTITPAHIPPSFEPSAILQPTMAPRNFSVPTGINKEQSSRTTTTGANSTAVVGFDAVRDLFDDIELNAIDEKRELSVLQTALSTLQLQPQFASPTLSNTNIETAASRHQVGADLSMWKSNTNNSALDGTDSTILALKSRLYDTSAIVDDHSRRLTESSFKQSNDGIFVQADFNADTLFAKSGDAFRTNVYTTDDSPLSLTLSG